MKLFKKRRPMTAAMWKIPFYSLIHPVDGLETLRYKNLYSMRVNAVILFVWLVSEVMVRKNRGFVFTNTNPDTVNVIDVFVGTLAVFFLLTIANLMLCTFMDAEGKYKDIVSAGCYATLLLSACNFLTILLTSVLSIEMMPFFVLFNAIFYVWIGLYLLGAVMAIHQFSIMKTVANLLLTVLGVVLIAALLFLLYSLGQQVASFFYTIYNEILFRL